MATVREILDSHERELLKRIEIFRTQISPLEAELLEVRQAKAALGKSAIGDTSLGAENNQFARMTNRELALTALKEHFFEGATISELLQFIKNSWGREIDKGSFSPQLSRLLKSGMVEKQGKVWRLKMN